MSLPTAAAARKAIPVYSGFVKYFPDAMVAVAELSRKGNDQHNPGKPLHWDRSKSGDEADALQRHLLEHGTLDTDGVRHSAKVAWRAMALLQKEIEADRVPMVAAVRAAVSPKPVAAELPPMQTQPLTPETKCGFKVGETVAARGTGKPAKIESIEDGYLNVRWGDGSAGKWTPYRFRSLL